jgi:hypothetical protein
MRPLCLRRPQRPLASLTMPWRPLGVTAVLAGLDLGAWEWATGTDHPTIGLVAGLLMAPIALALAWSIVRVLASLAQHAVRRLAGGTTTSGARSASRTATPAPFDIERDDERIAA